MYLLASVTSIHMKRSLTLLLITLSSLSFYMDAFLSSQDYKWFQINKSDRSTVCKNKLQIVIKSNKSRKIEQ